MYSFIKSPIGLPIIQLLTNTVVLHCLHIKIFLILKSGDIECNPGPRKSSTLKFYHWNLNGLFVHEFIKLSLLEG